MRKQQLVPALVLMLAVSLTAGASEVYKRVNEDGVVEFSDTPYPDADKIEVKPNVVETNPVQYQAPTASNADAGRTNEPASSDQRSSNANAEYARTTSRREQEEAAKSRENRESRKQPQPESEVNREAAVDPNPGRALRNAAGPR